MTEREIIVGSKAGKQNYQKLLYSNHCRLVMGICLRYTQNRQDAEDLFQDVFVTIFTKLDKYNFLGSFEGWIRRIAVHAAIDLFRRKDRFLTVASSDIIEDIDSQLLENVYVAEENETSIRYEQILGVLNELPDGYRTVFNLFAIEGYKHKEIAKILGCSEENSRSQYFKAKRIIKQKLTTQENIKIANEK